MADTDLDRRVAGWRSVAEAAGNRPLRLYLIAIGGTGTAPLACLLKEQGHEVVGSDLPLYPPMSDLLASAGIEPLVGFEREHIEQVQPDLVIVGNAVPRHNAEVQAAEAAGLPRLSMPEAVGHFLLADRKSWVAAGTHGKTTTSAMAAWVLAECGGRPGYLIGGAPIGLPASFALGEGKRFVIEGDEYNAAYFDRGPKFLHYRPETVTLTSVEYDHVDLYPSAASFRDAFERLVRQMPSQGFLSACVDTSEVRTIARAAPCRVVGYSHHPEGSPGALGAAGDLTGIERVIRPVREPTASASGTTVCIREENAELSIELGLWGEHNVANALAVYAAAINDGYAPEAVAAALGSFRGVRRRLEVLGEARGVVVVDDFAHHPTEVGASLRALADRFPGRRLVALFEPRSLSAGRSAFADAYIEAFAPAGRALLAPVFHAGRLGPGEVLDLDQLCRDLEARGIEASAFDSVDALRAAAIDGASPGDVLVTMSSGSFDGLPRALLAELGD